MRSRLHIRGHKGTGGRKRAGVRVRTRYETEARLPCCPHHDHDDDDDDDDDDHDHDHDDDVIIIIRLALQPTP